ncbi:hypothetical protein [Bordetella sp. BOR01]|uniref:hypothetical protein n=1 Tax=Bordetella sp. BOR01 TaxID=2854779 RepID=UPI001C48E7BE|nr:hypothetical protein [Bordetella sp. BOR01]MBV7481670.1 hypothetical protein [Bordetella sp. BOR01]
MKKALLAVALAASSIGMAQAAGFAIGVFGGTGSSTAGTQGGSQATSNSGSLGFGAAAQGTRSTSSTSANSGVRLTPQGANTYANGTSVNQSVGGGYTAGFAAGGTSGMAGGEYTSGATGNVGSIGFGGWSW